MPENTYTIKVETATAEKNVDALLAKVTALVTALGQLAQASAGGILSNPDAVGNLQGISQAQGGGGSQGPVAASVGAAQAQVTGGAAPTVSSTGTPAGTTSPTAAVGNVPAPSGGGTGAPAGIPVAGRQTGAPPGTKAPTSYSQLEAAVVAAEAAHAANPTVDTQYALSQAQNRLLQANRMISPPTGGGAFDWTSSQFARTGAGFIAGQSAVSQFTGWMGIGTQETIQGGYNLQARSRQAGEGIGIGVGALAGFAIGGPAGALIGGTFGQQIIGSLAEWSTAPAAAELDAFSTMVPSARVGGSPRMSAFQEMQSRLKSVNNPLLRPALSQLTGAWNALQGGLAQSGFPRLKGAYRGYNDRQLSLFGNPPQGVGYDLTQVLGLQYGSDAMGPIAKEQSEILASLAETGQNPADILSRFGAMPAARYYTMLGGTNARYLEGVINAGPYSSDLSASSLSQVAARTAAAEREGRLGAYKVRGSGAAVYGALGKEMSVLRFLPDGADSEAYAKAASQQRDAQMAMYAQQDIMAYAIPQTRIGAQRGVLNALPYAPGFRFGLELQSIAMNRQQMGVVEKRLAAGNLTEEQQLKLEEQLAGLQVSTATSISALTEGLENRLPALAAGRPSRFSRMDSTQLAALNVGRMGHPARSFGAINGRQLADQNAFVDALLGPGGANMVAPMSKDLPVGSSRVEALLERIAQILQQNGGAGQGPRTRVGEAVNKGQAVATGNPAPNYGNGNYN